MYIHRIDREILEKSHQVLSLSAGYDVSISDELEYFDSLGKVDWFAARSADGNVIGFLRYFPQDSNWSLGEIYVQPDLRNRSEIFRALMSEFQKCANFTAGHRLRFDLNTSDIELSRVIEESGSSQKKQVFRHFEVSLNQFKEKNFQGTYAVDLEPGQIIETLASLHEVSEQDVNQWISENSLRAISSGGKVVVVAHVSERGASCEIIRIATNKNFLRKGFAENLLKLICQEFAGRGKETLFLKVESTRSPAIELYRSFGFSEIKTKEQIWHSRWF